MSCIKAKRAKTFSFCSLSDDGRLCALVHTNHVVRKIVPGGCPTVRGNGAQKPVGNMYILYIWMVCKYSLHVFFSYFLLYIRIMNGLTALFTFLFSLDLRCNCPSATTSRPRHPPEFFSVIIIIIIIVSILYNIIYV